MSGFERANIGDAWTDAEELPFPDDFNPEEAAFATELREMFALERDDPPPLYAQTLLAEERYRAAEAGFEHKVVYRVFRSLRLPRSRLMPRRGLRPGVVALRESLTSLSRRTAAVMSAAMLFMTVTFLVATPSFAAGLRILLGQTGVQQVASYPSNVHSSRTHASAVHQKRDPFAEGAPLYWLGQTFNDFMYAGLQTQETDFAQGAMVDVQYLATGVDGRLPRMETPARLDVREFRITDAYAAVLQVVQVNAATEIMIGNDKAVYVDGSWGCYDCRQPIWQSGKRNQLIFQRDGVVFWIGGNRNDGVDKALLIAAAKQLAPAAVGDVAAARVAPLHIGDPMDGAPADPAQGEVLALVHAGDSPESGEAALVTSPSPVAGGK
jgi:hypothetical protein